MKNILKRDYKEILITAGVSLFVGALIFCLMFFLNAHTLTQAINSSALAGIVLFGVAMLLFLGRLGAFDIFAFGFKQVANITFSKKVKTKYTYIEYRDEKNTKRAKASHYYLGMLFVALLFIIAVVVLEIIYHTAVH